jgi:hypothetical protein
MLIPHSAVSVAGIPLADFKAPDAVSVVSGVDDIGPELPNNIPLDTEATKEDIDASELDAVPEGPSCCPLPTPESDDDETFYYKGVDWTPEEPASLTRTQAPLPGLHPPLECHHGQIVVPTPSLSVKSIRDFVNTHRYATDDIHVGIKGQREREFTLTRCTTVDNLSGILRATKTTDGNHLVGIISFSLY